MGDILMHQKLKQEINNFIQDVQQTNPNSLFILKGLPDYFEKELAYLLGFQLDQLNDSKLLTEAIDRLNNAQTGKKYILHYHELLFLSEINLLGLFLNLKNKLNVNFVMINIDIFFERYPSFDRGIMWDVIYQAYNLEQKNTYHSVLSNLIIDDEAIIYSYVDLDFVFDQVYNLSDRITQTEVHWISAEISSGVPVVNLESNLDALFISLAKVIAQNTKIISIITTDHSSIAQHKNFKLLQLLSFIGIQLNHVADIPFQQPPASDLYLNILKRKNPTFQFRMLKIYKNPSLYGNEIQEISQEVIIDEIYCNIKKAHESQLFTDTFVTSPTGSGKSIMFQIPAILAAEQLNLVTIVISPLIGLMNDQVSNIASLTSCAATINSDISPIEKEQIKERILTLDENGKYLTSILYISPETLLSNRDIKALIGERKIGLVVIDEAHIVATWGKSFRPDYWYLGEYLRYLRKEDHFPIAAFTATAVFGGSDDMYYDILDSLFLNVNRPYLGVVKRENIGFQISLRQKVQDYEKEKRSFVVDEIENNLNLAKKTLYYFPYRSIINTIQSNALIKITKAKADQLGVYMGGDVLHRIVKQQTLDDFGNGKMMALLATKAFGMGIDIDDIDVVYHYAPTGNLADYVQEVGRIARKSSIQGVAKTDYFEEDFRYIKQLYGLSSVKQFEVNAVVKKILEIYTKEKKRNFMVSPEAFAFIFGTVDYEDVETRLKSILLIIKKDLETTKGLFPFALIFKPRTMFTEGLFLITDEDKNSDEFKNLHWDKFLKLSVNQHELVSYTTKFVHGKLDKTKISYLGSLYELDFKALWEERYRDLSFGSFKHAFYENELTDANKNPIDLKTFFKPKVMVDLKTKDNIPLKMVAEQIREFLNIFDQGLSYFKNQGKHFSIDSFADYIKNSSLSLAIKSNQLGLIISSIINLLNNTLSSIGSFNANENFLSYNGVTNLYSIKNVLYKKRINFLLSNLQSNFGVSLDTEKRFISGGSKKRGSKISLDPLILISQIAELLDLVSYKIKAGDNAQLFMRVNSDQSLFKIANGQIPSKTIELVRYRHENSIRWMKYFFEDLSDDQQRWETIENYFLGKELNE